MREFRAQLQAKEKQNKFFGRKKQNYVVGKNNNKSCLRAGGQKEHKSTL